ncbi:DUF72 domain-containing protein [Chitinophaga sp. GCM10012297]|uniref:DUF72 domain-containing protein n=1 Tax=Chitinophaga chungangae TaxID=2821488 RepID=A0ABS3YBJ7_9BACT|nr:DUF72 domain-containing protein [Chitinophaga chungangae]MBO9151855.1 DUF72 domain-containing protein [Chitinophaga chungangae]
MQFGRQDLSILNNIDFKLPAEPAFNGEVLCGKPAAAPQVRLGATSWNRKDWLGGVFPKGTKEKDFLSEYSKHFDSVELNATHYKIYPPETIRGWAEKVNTPGFRFSPKVPQSISHYSNLVNARDQTDAFLEGALAFGNRLGPVFMQMSESFGPARKDLLFTYLASLPKDLSFFVELRHPDWFADPHHSSALYHNLRNLGIGLVITDTAGRRDVVHMHLPVPRAMIRFVGNSLHPTDYQRADDWVNRLAYWLANGLREADIFMHMHNDTAVPEMAVYLGEKLEAATGLKIRKPYLHRGNTLF